jgi:NAD(P)-dependent dehydrogenase (short-subunit alcohol dehydrogenase family)
LNQYGYSKLLNVMHARSMHKIFNSKGVQCNTLHPGAIHTALARDASYIQRLIVNPLMYLFFKTPFQGSKTTIHVVTKKDNVSGEYYDDARVAKMSTLAMNDTIVQDLYDWSLNEVKNYLPK